MVNSFDEWSRLREVIVGNHFTFDLPEMDLSFKLFYHDNTFGAIYMPAYEKDTGLALTEGEKRPAPGLKMRYLEELAEDIDELVTTLRSLGVVVHRPTPLDKTIEFSTPYWSATAVPALNVRDQAIIFGDEIIETPPLLRARYFENDLLKPVFYRYFKAGARWTVMPRPIMTDRSFDMSYVESSVLIDIKRYSMGTPYEQKDSPHDIGLEMMIDAAQCVRFGRDVIVNVATENHQLGLDWLERHLDGRFRLHRIYRMTDNHIDSIVLPLRPGLLLLRSPEYREMLPPALQKWDVIYPPEPTDNIFPTYEDDDLILTSRFIDLNVLSIDEETVIVNALFPELGKVLERRGFTVVPVRHRHRRLFGGGFHCFTLDTVRDGGPEDYFG